TPIYHVFRQYRDKLVGSKVDARVEGPSIATAALQPSIDGDSHEADFVVEALPYVDAAAVLSGDGNIYLALVNRSHETSHQVTVELPAGYPSESIWILTHEPIIASNSSKARTAIAPLTKPIPTRRGKLTTD